jgi:hypothetical protein
VIATWRHRGHAGIYLFIFTWRRTLYTHKACRDKPRLAKRDAPGQDTGSSQGQLSSYTMGGAGFLMSMTSVVPHVHGQTRVGQHKISVLKASIGKLHGTFPCSQPERGPERCSVHFAAHLITWEGQEVIQRTLAGNVPFNLTPGHAEIGMLRWFWLISVCLGAYCYYILQSLGATQAIRLCNSHAPLNLPSSTQGQEPCQSSAVLVRTKQLYQFSKVIME